MHSSAYRPLTSRGIVLISASPSQIALDDPNFELFGVPDNQETLTKSIGAVDTSHVNTIAYDLGEVVREAVVPALILESADARNILEQLLAIPTLTDITLDARDSKGPLPESWVAWLISLRRLTGLTLINFTDVVAFERCSSEFQSLARLNIGFSCFNSQSLVAFSRMNRLSYLYLSGVMTEESEFIPFHAPSVRGLIYKIRGNSAEPLFLAHCYTGLKCLRIDTSDEVCGQLQEKLRECSVILERD